MNRLKKFVLFLLAFSFVFSFVGCSDSNSGPDPKDVITEEDGLDYLWPEDRYMPTFVNEPAEHIDFIDLTEFSDEVILLMTSLKAIVNAEQPRIYSRDRVEDYFDWLPYIGYSEDKVTVYADPYELFDKYVKEEEIKNIVISDSAVVESINAASTLAGITDSLVVTTDLYQKLLSLGYKFNVLQDFTGMFKTGQDVNRYIFEHWFSQGYVNKRILFGTDPGIPGCLREYAMALGCACVYFDINNEEDKALLEEYADLMPKGYSQYAGWFPAGNEEAMVTFLSEHGIVMTSADFFTNIPFLSGQKVEKIQRKRSSEMTLENKIYVMYGVTDGDNMGSYMQQAFPQMLFSDIERDFPISWTISPNAAFLMPRVLQAIYDEADAELDDFLSGPTGAAYTFPGIQDKSWRDHYIRVTDEYMEAADLNVLNTWNEAGPLWANPMTEDLKKAYVENLKHVTGILDQCYSQPYETIEHITFARADEPYAPSDDADEWFTNMMEDAYLSYMMDEGKSPIFLSIMGNAWGGENTILDMKTATETISEKYPDIFEFVTITQYLDLIRQHNEKIA